MGASLASEKIQSSNMLGSGQQSAKTSAILELIAGVINSETKSFDIQATLVKELSRIFVLEAAALFLLDEDQAELVQYTQGLAQPLRLYRVDLNWENGLIERCLLSQEADLCHDLPLDEARSLPAALQDIPAQSTLCLTLRVRDQSIGALVLASADTGHFSAHDRQLLGFTAQALARRMHNERLIQELQVANADLEVNRWQLLNSRNILRALFDSIPASIYIISRNYNLAAINMHRANRRGESPNLLFGRRCYEALYGLENPCPDCLVSETLFGGQSTNRTRRQGDNQFDLLDWEISSYPIHDKNEKVVQAILLEQDVTEKRRLEATLAQSEKLAAVGQLAAGLAHEINNPLTAVIANAQILMRELPADDDKQELVDLIARAGERATQVVRNLLDLARKEQYHFAPINVNDTIAKSLALLNHEIVARAVKLKLEFDENISKVVASQDHLEGVWINLLTNAIDALENEPREIHIWTRQFGSEVHVGVADNGQGISTESLSRIFEPFYTTKEPGRGTGLGLSVCHRVIKQHGGRILVDSQVNSGTQFTIILPAAD